MVRQIRCCCVGWSGTSVGLVPRRPLSACPRSRIRPPRPRAKRIPSPLCSVRQFLHLQWYWSVTHSLLSSPAVPSVSDTTPSLTAVWHGGSGTLEAWPQKVAVHWGLPARTVYNGPDLLLVPDSGNGLWRHGREIRILTQTKPISLSWDLFLRTTTRGLPCFSQRKRNCRKMKPLEKTVQTTFHDQTVVWQGREWVPGAPGEDGDLQLSLIGSHLQGPVWVTVIPVPLLPLSDCWWLIRRTGRRSEPLAPTKPPITTTAGGGQDGSRSLKWCPLFPKSQCFVIR